MANMPVSEGGYGGGPDFPQAKEKPFEGMKVYFSGSIKGAPEADPNFAWELVRYMTMNGANVLSEHVAGRNKEEMEEIRARKMNVPVEYFKRLSRADFLRDVVRKQDVAWVDEASHLVALVNAPSHGVGMEIERAILKPERGLNKTPILCLVHEDLVTGLSGMISGVSEVNDKAALFVRTYRTLQDADYSIYHFLKGKLI